VIPDDTSDEFSEETLEDYHTIMFEATICEEEDITINKKQRRWMNFDFSISIEALVVNIM